MGIWYEMDFIIFFPLLFYRKDVVKAGMIKRIFRADDVLWTLDIID